MAQVALVVLAGLLTQLAPPQKTETVLPSSVRDRRRHLERILKEGGRGFEVLWAAEELASLGGHDKSTIDVLLGAVSRGTKGEQPELGSRVIYALASSGRAGVPHLLEALKVASGDEYELLLIVLCRMGQEAKQARPYLLQRLKDPLALPQTRALLRVVVASIGGDSRELRTKILEDLRDAHTRYYTLKMMAYASERPWIDADLIVELVKGLEALAHEPMQNQAAEVEEMEFIILALSRAGDKVSSFAGRLEALQKKFLMQNNLLSIPMTLMIARIDHNRADQVLRRLFPKFNRLANTGRSSTAALLEDVYQLVDADVSNYLARALQDRDPDVAAGAATLLWYSGLAASKAFPTVLKYVRSDAAVQARERAADTLARITPFSRVAELKAAAKEEKSAEVRRRLQSAIDKILTLKISP